MPGPFRSTAASRDGVGLPEIPLSGGPYDGALAAASDEEQIRGVAIFPDKVIVTGEKGSAVYTLKQTKTGRRGDFSHMG